MRIKSADDRQNVSEEEIKYIVDEIVGEIEDEFDPDIMYLTSLSKRVWLVDGRFSCDDAIELGWPI